MGHARSQEDPEIGSQQTQVNHGTDVYYLHKYVSFI